MVMTQNMPDFGEWSDRMIQGQRIPDAHHIQFVADSGYAGIQDYLQGINAMLPYKKPRGGEITATQKAQNKAHSSKRISVEHVFAHVKNWKIISGRYEGTVEEFNTEFNGICGMCNKRKIWQDGTYHRWKKKIIIYFKII